MARARNSGGIICDRCNKFASSFNHYKITNSTTSKGDNFNKCSSDIKIKSINKSNLCAKCYLEYRKMMINFLDLKGGEYIE